MKINELKELLETQQAEVKDLSAVNALLDEVMEQDEVTEEPETEEEPEEEPEEAAEEDSSEEATEEETPEEEPSEEPIELSAVIDEIVSLRNQVATLTEQLQATQVQLAAKEKAEAEFIAKFKNLSAVIREEEKPVVKEHKIGMTNGIGEL